MERKWQMIRLGAGDYLLPSNDGQTWWRFNKYEERDGSLTRGDGSVVNGDYWRLLRWSRAAHDLTLDALDLEADYLWTEVACMMPTRQAAIDYALELDARQIAS